MRELNCSHCLKIGSFSDFSVSKCMKKPEDAIFSEFFCLLNFLSLPSILAHITSSVDLAKGLFYPGSDWVRISRLTSGIGSDSNRVCSIQVQLFRVSIQI